MIDRRDPEKREEVKEHALASALEDWKHFSIMKFDESTAKMVEIEKKLEHNTFLTQELMDMVRVGKLLQSLVKWAIAMGVGLLALWNGIGKFK